MMHLDGECHRRLRDSFGGFLTARRVRRYQAIITVCLGAPRARMHGEAGHLFYHPSATVHAPPDDPHAGLLANRVLVAIGQVSSLPPAREHVQSVIRGRELGACHAAQEA
jgi:hypothetical protein